MLSAFIVTAVMLAVVSLGWALDRRAAIRREDDAMTDGVWMGKLIGQVSEQAKSEMFADVMASHHERTQNVSDKDWNWYMIGTLAFAVTCMAMSALAWWFM